jgi:hypothetical protein
MFSFTFFRTAPKYIQKRPGASSASSSEIQAAGAFSSFRRSAVQTVFPNSAGAETSVTRRRSFQPSISRASSCGRRKRLGKRGRF